MAVTETAVRDGAAVVSGTRAGAVRKLAWILALVAGVVLVVTGPVLVGVGLNGKSQVASQLKQEHITTAADSATPNVPVKDAATAQVQADVIWKHMMESSGGKTYAQLPRDSKVRPTLATGDSLRASLLSAVLAWNVANLVIGLGAVFLGLGIVFLFVGLALRPARAATS